ncbi:hypothetical protein KI387_010998, partial [Taxus chinensis]
IPEHKKRAFEYLGFKGEEIIQGRDVNKVETPLTVAELEKPQVLEEPGEPPEVYLGTSLVKTQLNVDPFFTTL